LNLFLLANLEHIHSIFIVIYYFELFEFTILVIEHTNIAFYFSHVKVVFENIERKDENIKNQLILDPMVTLS